MKLHLPKMLTAALLAAITALIAGQQAQAATMTDHTTQGDVTYNGYVFTMISAGQLDKTFSTRTYREATYQDGAWVNGDKEYVSSNKAIDTPLGNGAFWHAYTSSANITDLAYGNTLRLSGATGQQRAGTDFTDFTIGGLIADDNFGSSSAGTPAYWFFRGGSMDINGIGDVNMDVNSHVRFSYGGSVNMKKGGTWNIHSGKSLTFDNNSQNTATTFNLFEDQALTVKGGGTLNLGRGSNGTYSVDMKFGSSLHVTEQGTTVNVVAAGTGTFTVNGTITVDGGSTLNISQNTTLGRTITNAGTLTVASGKVVTLSSDLNGFDHTATYVDYTGNPGENGFAGNLYYTIVKNTGTLNNLSSVKLSDGTTQALDENGGFAGSGSTDYSTYHVNTNGATVSVKSASAYATEHGSGATLTTVYVKGANDTVSIDANFNGMVEVVGTGAVLDIQGNSVFSGTLTSGTLKGTGTYALVAGTTSLAPSVTLGSGWTGAVRISSTSEVKNLAADKLVNADGTSWIEFYGFKGFTVTWAAGTYGNMTQNVILTKTGDTPAWELSAFAQSLNTMVATGTWKGDGTFKTAGGNSGQSQGVEYQGNISEWTGAFEANAPGKRVVTFSNHADEVNASFKKTGGTGAFELVVDTDVTFNNELKADKLTINEGMSATLKGVANIGALDGAGSLVVNAAEHTVALGGGSIANTIGLQAGTLSLAGAYNLDAMEPTDYDEEYVGPEEGVAAGSGFHKVSGTIQVVTIDNGTLSLAEGATFSYQNADVEVNHQTGEGTFGGVDLTTLWVNGTDPVSYNAAQEYAEQKAPGTIVSTVHLNYDGATITMDRAGASVALVLSEDEEVTSGTVYATKDTTISGITGWSGKELVIDGTSTVTTGALTLDNNGTKLTVAAGATLDIAGNGHNLTLQHGSATIDGTVTIAHELDLSKGKTSDAVLVIGSTGNVTATDGLWLRGERSFSILEDGRFTVKGLTFIGQGEDSTIRYNDVDTADGNYSTTEAKYVITNMTIQANKDVTISNTLVNSIVVTGDHAVTLNTNAASVIVSDGGTFTKGAGVTVEDITVEGSGTIAGNVEVSEIGITAGSVAAFEQGLPEDSGVTFSNDDSHTPITVENIGEGTIHYDGIGQEDAKVTADNLVFFMAGGPATVDNCVSVGSVQNLYSEGALTLTNVDTDTLREVEAVMGNVVLENVESVDLQKLTISGATVAVYQGDTESAEGMVNINETLTAGGGTLLANLTLVGTDGHVSLDLSDITAQEGWAALTLGSQFGIAEGTLVTLDAVTISALEGLRIGDSLDLIQALSPDDQLTYLNDAYDGMWFDALFERVDGVKGDYLVYATRESFGLTKVSNVPEPTTGTLSLLALMALAARRRRK